jgi:DUF1680 family protein
MHRLYPDVESYVFEIEQSLYNVVFALQYSHLHIRSFAILDERVREPVRPNSCCSGTGTKIMACLPEYLFTLNENTLYCDIFADAELIWQREAGNIKVTEKTNFPFDGKVSFTFESDAPHDYSVKFRIPCYSAASVPIYLNGEKIAEGEAGSYVTLTRLWQSSDKVDFEIPFAWKCHNYSGEHDVEGYSRTAYTYGPLLYALRGPRNHINGTVVAGKGADLPACLTKKRGKPLHFKVKDMPGYDLIPYYEIIPGEHFVCFPLFEK